MICMTSEFRIHAQARSVIQTRRRHDGSDGPYGAEDILVESWDSIASITARSEFVTGPLFWIDE
jgi:hypothetical protein